MEEVGEFDGIAQETCVKDMKVPVELIPPKSQTIEEPLKNWFPVTITLVPGNPFDGVADWAHGWTEKHENVL